MNGDPGWRRRRHRRLRARRITSLSEEFYETQPGIYLTTRLAHYMLVASNDAEHRQRLADGIELDRVRVLLDVASKPTQLPTWSQRVAAVEGEALASLASETVLRWVHAHAKVDVESPWLEMASTTHFATFKKWVRVAVVEANPAELRALVERVMPLPPQVEVAAPTIAGWLRAFGRTFLEAESYNATKHGLAVTGRATALRVEIAGETLIDAQGNQIDFLRSEYDKADKRRSFFRTSVLSDPSAVAPFVMAAVDILEAIEARGRERFLREPATAMRGFDRYETAMGRLGYNGKPVVRTDRAVHLDGISEGQMTLNFHPRRTPGQRTDEPREG